MKEAGRDRRKDKERENTLLDAVKRNLEESRRLIEKREKEIEGNPQKKS